MEILLCHLVGDYVLQDDWMARNKTKSWFVAGVHAFSYTLAYLWLTQSLFTLLIIGVTHLLIDRFRLARFVVYGRNRLLPGGYVHPWSDCAVTGSLDEDKGGPPAWLAVWVMIIVDNTMHLLINWWALTFFAPWWQGIRESSTNAWVHWLL